MNISERMIGRPTLEMNGPSLMTLSVEVDGAHPLHHELSQPSTMSVPVLMNELPPVSHTVEFTQPSTMHQSVLMSASQTMPHSVEMNGSHMGHSIEINQPQTISQAIGFSDSQAVSQSVGYNESPTISQSVGFNGSQAMDQQVEYNESQAVRQSVEMNGARSRKNGSAKREKRDLRQIYYYEFRLGRSAGQTAKNINEVWGEGTVKESSIRKWFQKFRKGSVNIDQKSRRGPAPSVDDQALKALVEQNPYTTIKELAKQLNCSTTSIGDHLKRIGKKKEFYKWV